MTATASTEGRVHSLTATTADPYGDKEVVGTKVVVKTQVTGAKGKTHTVESSVFLAPNSVLPTMGAKVIIVMGEEAVIELPEGDEVIAIESVE